MLKSKKREVNSSNANIPKSKRLKIRKDGQKLNSTKTPVKVETIYFNTNQESDPSDGDFTDNEIGDTRLGDQQRNQRQSKASNSASRQMQCPICSQCPPVTMENIVFLENILSFMKKTYELQKKNDTVCNHAGHSKEGEDTPDPITLSRLSGPGKIELQPQSAVWIDKTEVRYIDRWKSKPAEMVRRLLKHLVGEQNLRTMTARGKGDKKGIPENILKAVECYVNETAAYKLDPGEYIRVINLLCGTLRYQRKKLNQNSAPLGDENLERVVQEGENDVVVIKTERNIDEEEEDEEDEEDAYDEENEYAAIPPVAVKLETETTPSGDEASDEKLQTD